MIHNSTQASRTCLFFSDSHLNERGIKATEQNLEQPYRTTRVPAPLFCCWSYSISLLLFLFPVALVHHLLTIWPHILAINSWISHCCYWKQTNFIDFQINLPSICVFISANRFIFALTFIFHLTFAFLVFYYIFILRYRNQSKSLSRILPWMILKLGKDFWHIDEMMHNGRYDW